MAVRSQGRMKPTRYRLHGIGSFSDGSGLSREKLAKCLAYFCRSIDYGRTTTTQKTVRATSAASGADFEKRRSSKRLDSSVNIMAPVVAKAHLRMQARKEAKKRGTLK